MSKGVKTIMAFFKKMEKSVLMELLIISIFLLGKVYNPVRILDFNKPLLSLVLLVLLLSALLVMLLKYKGIKFKHANLLEKITDYGVSFLGLMFVVSIFTTLVMSVTIVDGSSMDPSLKNNQLIAVSHIYKIDRFDVVVIDKEDSALIVKRVIGLPGDNLLFQDEDLYVNGKLQNINFKTKGSTLIVNVEFTVPNNEYFVLGDNRDESYDSRSFGFVKRSEIVAQVLFK